MRNHFITFRSDLRYDGRVCAMIRTLAMSFPQDTIFLYELLLGSNAYDVPIFPDNVIIKRPNLLLAKIPVKKFSKILGLIEFYFRSFCFLLYRKPVTIQLHYEICLLPALVYKLLFRRTKLVYNDQEMYHYKDKNLILFLYLIEYAVIKYADLLIETNEYRRKAVFYLHKNNLNRCLIIDNYVFEPTTNLLSKRFIVQFNVLKNKKQCILLHQGMIDANRGGELLLNIVNNIPEGWIMVFIGITKENFTTFQNEFPVAIRHKMYYMGLIPYPELNSLYAYIDAAVLFYNAETFNNKYCAPNRLYSAVNNGVPIIVNKDNVSLSDFIKKFHNGIAISDLRDIVSFFDRYSSFKEAANTLKGKYQYDNYIDVLSEAYKQIC